MAGPRPDDHVGRILGGRFRLIEPIGSGGSAFVYRGQDSVLARPVAVKLLRSGLAGDPAFWRRFLSEAQSAAALNHPNVTGVLDWGEEEDAPFLVLEYLAGGSLRDLLDRNGPLALPQVVEIGRQAASGLEYAARRGLVHRDIKPANLLFDEDGRLRVSDFGLARALAEASWTEPLGVVLGTARYASPEQALGQMLDSRSDVYSLGLVLYETAMGRVPFVGDNQLSTLMARVGAKLPIDDGIGPLGQVLLSACAPEVADRPVPGELLSELDRLARDLPPPSPLPISGPVAYRPGQGGVQSDETDRSLDRTALITSREPGAGFSSGGVEGDPTMLGPTTRLAAVAVATQVPPQATRERSGLGRKGGLILGLVVLLIIAGAGLAVLRFVIFKYEVPALVGRTRVEAVQALHRDHLVAVFGASRYSPVRAKGEVLAETPAPGSLARAGDKVFLVLSEGPKPVSVPSLAGLSQSQAASRLADLQLKGQFTTSYSTTVGAGTVISWTPDQGQVLPGTTVDVTVSAGPAPVDIPDLADDSWSHASAVLSSDGLKPVETLVFSSSVQNGLVVATQPAAGQTVHQGDSVTVEVSKGPVMVQVPNLDGDTLNQAAAALSQAGLTVGAVLEPPGNNEVVFVSNPQAGQTVPEGTPVDLYLESGG